MGPITVKDSCLLLTTKLEKFNADYGLKDICEKYDFVEAKKYEQSYTFLTSDMFKEYLNNGGESATIKWYADNGGLKPSHFNNMTET